MLTPQDIQNKTLEKAVFGGYDMAAVDDFLETVAQDYAAIYKETAILKSKMKVLVEKVEEYRSTEDAMRMALLTAQKMGDDLLADAKKKSKNLLVEADTAAKSKLEEIQQEIAAEEKRLADAKLKTKAFVEEAKQLLAKQVDFLRDVESGAELKDVPVVPAQTSAAAKAVSEAQREAEIVGAAREIDAAVSKMLKSDPVPANQKTAAVNMDETRTFRTKGESGIDWSDDDEYTSPRPKFNFDDLQFGSNYTDEL